jgi:alpha-methylacyl-CoA racemase
VSSRSEGAAPLTGVRVLDFSSLLPGPLCTLLLAQAGAEVTKIERPGGGDDMRGYEPKFGADSVNFALLNRGKRFVELDLKSDEGREAALALAKGADVLVEQFRPGVMDRLGLGYEAVREANPRIVYCSISGWGQAGPLAAVAAHDLNYQAEAGLLSLSCGADGTPAIPNILTADIVGGAYPAVMNILLALRSRDAGAGAQHIDVSMADNLFPLMYWALGNGFAAGQWPTAGSELVTGGSPRYQVYATADGRYLAAAPLEDRFWRNFLRVIDAPYLLDEPDEGKVKRSVAVIVAGRSSAEWERRFAGVDACVNVVKTLREAVESRHFRQRGVFGPVMGDGSGRTIPALPTPVAPALRSAEFR